MPIFDFYCKECGFEDFDVYIRNPDNEVLCKECGAKMDKRPPNFSMKVMTSTYCKHKHKFGSGRLPRDYKFSGGANVYPKPRN